MRRVFEPKLLFDGASITTRRRMDMTCMVSDLTDISCDEPSQGDVISINHVLIGAVSGGYGLVENSVEGSAPWRGPKRTGSAGFYPAGRHGRHWRSEGAVTLITLAFKPEASFEFFGGEVFSEWQTRPSAEDAFVSPALSCLAEAMLDAGSLADLTAESIASCLFLHASRRFAKRPGQGPLGCEDLTRVLDLIHGSLPHAVSLADMTAVSRLPRARFISAFREATGTSPRQYILRERAARARALIENTRLPLSEVAAQVGCANAGHLARLVRQHLGASPNAWRNGRSRL